MTLGVKRNMEWEENKLDFNFLFSKNTQESFLIK